MRAGASENKTLGLNWLLMYYIYMLTCITWYIGHLVLLVLFTVDGGVVVVVLVVIMLVQI